jgi:hypothetical protein
MASVYVDFSGPDQSAVVAVFSGPQDEADHPDQGEISDADPRYVAFAAPLTSLAGAKAAKLAELNTACQQAILAGFASSALGAAYTYPAKATDQQNLTASVVASLLPGLAAGWTTPFWCADAGGAWAFRAHTAVQIQQVGDDGKTAILAAMQKNQTLADQVNACTTVAAVNAISWA